MDPASSWRPDEALKGILGMISDQKAPFQWGRIVRWLEFMNLSFYISVILQFMNLYILYVL